MGRGASKIAVALAIVMGVATGAVVVPSPATAATAGTARVAATRLNIRSGPSTNYKIIRTVSRNTRLAVACRVIGESIHGSVRKTSIWNKLTNGRFVTDAYLIWPKPKPSIPMCSFPATPQEGTAVNLRRNASTLLAPAGQVAQIDPLNVVCQVGGERVVGPTRTTSIWDRLTNGYFVSDAHVAFPGTRPDMPWCSFSAPMAPAVGTPFIRWAAGYAQQEARLYRVPASVSIAQAVHESGWGRSGLTRDGNSYFGMKCFGTPGVIALGCRPYRTHECTPSCYATSASFRVYGDVWSSFKDHGRSLSTLARYRKAFNHVNDPDQFIIEVHKAGYATGPTYAQSIIRIMRQYNLYRYDITLPET
jgi:flagellar protein FlgJ